MNILYVATDVILEANNGGARRAYETSKIFSLNGHKSVLFVDKGINEKKFEVRDGIKIYRKALPKTEQNIRDLGRMGISITKKKISKLSTEPKNKNNQNKNNLDGRENDARSQYESYLGDNTPKDLHSKLVDFYRHKFPIHKYLKWFPAIRTLFKIIKKEKIDIIIERGPSYGLGAFIAKLTNRFYVVDFIDIMYANWALKKADLILSYFTTHQIPAFIPREKIWKVWTVTDEKLFKPRDKDNEIMNMYGIKESDFVCVYIGGMFPWHGLNSVVETAKKMKELMHEDIKFLLVGDGIVRKSIEESVQRDNLSEIIKLPGKVAFDEVPRYLSCANVALSLNTGDSIGFKLLEYMSSGLPIIATNADILHLIARNNKEALYVNINDLKDLMEKILFLKENPKIMKDMSKDARNRVIEKYTWKKHYQNLIAGIYHILKNNYS